MGNLSRISLNPSSTKVCAHVQASLFRGFLTVGRGNFPNCFQTFPNPAQVFAGEDLSRQGRIEPIDLLRSARACTHDFIDALFSKEERIEGIRCRDQRGSSALQSLGGSGYHTENNCMITYRELLEKLSLLSDEQLNSTVTIRDQHDEWYPGIISIQDGDDVLDDGHPFIEPVP